MCYLWQKYINHDWDNSECTECHLTPYNVHTHVFYLETRGGGRYSVSNDKYTRCSKECEHNRGTTVFGTCSEYDKYLYNYHRMENTNHNTQLGDEWSCSSCGFTYLNHNPSDCNSNCDYEGPDINSDFIYGICNFECSH